MRTQSPKVVIFEIDFVNDLLIDINLNGEIYYTRGIRESKDKQGYLRQCFGTDKSRYLSYYIPLYAFQHNWVNLKKENFKINSGSIDFYKTMGYVYTEEITSVTIDNPSTFPQNNLSEEALAVLDRIISTCKENNIKIVFIQFQGLGLMHMAMLWRNMRKKMFGLYELMGEVGINRDGLC